MRQPQAKATARREAVAYDAGVSSRMDSLATAGLLPADNASRSCAGERLGHRPERETPRVKRESMASGLTRVVRSTPKGRWHARTRSGCSYPTRRPN
jgi:hypothetical protein